ncbi:zinc metallopeptidase [bacterium]|nr:zinc metallopeptidase [bacterium]
MRWKGRRESSNVIDNRGRSRRGRIPRGGKRLGIGATLAVLAASYFLGVDPNMIFSLLGGGNASYSPPGAAQSAPYQPSAQEQDMARFTGVVLADTEDTWNTIFASNGRTYREPRLELYSGVTQSACGTGQAAMGPFYCPGDSKVYIDLSFFNDLKQRHQAPGDFAQAYVIAHEVGHHVQNLLGTSIKVQQMRQQLSKTEGNKLSVKLELQADCYAGLWAHSARRQELLEPGDIEEALQAASQIGDDRLQKQSRGYVTPESFTHGTSAQRVKWFTVGYKTGSVDACNTFGA